MLYNYNYHTLRIFMNKLFVTMMMSLFVQITWYHTIEFIITFSKALQASSILFALRLVTRKNFNIKQFD